MDKSIIKIELTTGSDKNGSYYRIVFQNEWATIFFNNGKTEEERMICHSYPVLITDISQVFEDIKEFEELDAYFFEENAL